MRDRETNTERENGRERRMERETETRNQEIEKNGAGSRELENKVGGPVGTEMKSLPLIHHLLMSRCLG